MRSLLGEHPPPSASAGQAVEQAEHVPRHRVQRDTARELVAAVLQARLGDTLAADPVVGASEPREFGLEAVKGAEDGGLILGEDHCNARRQVAA